MRELVRWGICVSVTGMALATVPTTAQVMVAEEFAGCTTSPNEDAERCHQGLESNLIVPMERPPDVNAEVETTERLGGLLRSYRRAA